MKENKIPKFLFNKYNREYAEKLLAKEDFKRKTVSFYRYSLLADPVSLRDELFIAWSELGVLGRIYLAKEGINAQLNVPEHHWDKFVDHVHSYSNFKGIPLVQVLNGRYGVFIQISPEKGKKINVKIPKDVDPKTLSRQDCLDLMENQKKK